jgi:sulfate adenylyltransferase subunit 1
MQDINLSTLKFITCGSVDDGKSTLIGRLLVDSKAVLQDQLAGVSKSGTTDLALFTDGLSAEREQGITIDVAYRYFSTPRRKFIIGDAPGHEQYTRNMVTAASSADAAVVLVDATKLDWKNPSLQLLPQTRRHSLLVHLLRVPSIVFAINKLDAVDDAALAFKHISKALHAFAGEANIDVAATVPISALTGSNVVEAGDDFSFYSQTPSQDTYQGTLLSILEQLPNNQHESELPLSFPVQWVEKFSESSDTSQGRRVFWGRVATGGVQPGQEVTILPSGQIAKIAQVLDHARKPSSVLAGLSAGIVLDREVDISRGDWLLAPNSFKADRNINATVAWMDDMPLVAGRTYWALHGHRWVKARVTRIAHRLNVNTLAEEDATELAPNEIGSIQIALQEPLATLPYAQSRTLGALILVDTASHKTSGAVLIS